jgi:glycosyltransferase involved in cell wall biosynthesis
MHICFLTYEYPPFILGGAGKYAEYLVDELARKGHKISVFAPKSPHHNAEPPRKENIDVHYIPIINKSGLNYISFQYGLLKKFSQLHRRGVKFDLMHVNGVSGFILRKSACPKVATIHHSIVDIQQRLSLMKKLTRFSGEENPIGTYLEKGTILHSHQIIAVSEATKRFLIRDYNLFPNNVHVIYNGIHTDHFIFQEDTIAEIRKKFGLKNDEKLILSTPGRVDDVRKGIIYLLQALIPLSKTVKFKCIITGSGNASIFKEILDKLPSNCVVFPGLIDENDKRKLIAACDVFVLPSLLEGCPIAILEALAAGAPIVSTKVGGIPELVHNENGILAQPRTPADIQEGILKIFHDPILSGKMRAINRNDAYNRFSWDTAVNLTEDIYKKAIAEYYA